MKSIQIIKDTQDRLRKVIEDLQLEINTLERVRKEQTLQNLKKGVYETFDDSDLLNSERLIFVSRVIATALRKEGLRYVHKYNRLNDNGIFVIKFYFIYNTEQCIKDVCSKVLEHMVPTADVFFRKGEKDHRKAESLFIMIDTSLIIEGT